MRVTNCTQNNMPKQSFGMEIKLDTATNALILPFRLIPRMQEAIAEANPRIADLPGDMVTLSYAGYKYDPTLQMTTGNLWNMTRQGIWLPTRIETISYAPNNKPFILALLEGAQKFAEKIQRAGLA